VGLPMTLFLGAALVSLKCRQMLMRQSLPSFEQRQARCHPLPLSPYSKSKLARGDGGGGGHVCVGDCPLSREPSRTTCGARPPSPMSRSAYVTSRHLPTSRLLFSIC
jgi:hypothetical protein